MPMDAGTTNTPGMLEQQKQQTDDIDCPSCEYTGPFYVLNTNAPGGKISVICPNCRKQSSSMAITPQRDNGGNFRKDEKGNIKVKHTAQKRDSEGIPTKENYRGPRVPRFDEEVGPEDVDSISPFTEERQGYKYTSKSVCSASYVPGSLEEMLVREAQSIADEFPEDFEKESDDEDYDFEDDTEDSWPCDMCDGEVFPIGKMGSRVHGRCRNCGMNSSHSMANKANSIGLNKTASVVTTDELETLTEPYMRSVSANAVEKLIKTADGPESVFLHVGKDCQWCPKLKRSVSFVVCSDYCIDGRREPANASKKSPETYTDMLIEGGDASGRVVCGYKEWMKREMDRFHPGWVNDHIKSMGGKILGGDTPFGGQRMNLDDGQRSRLPSYPSEFNVEKTLEERRKNNPETGTDKD